MKAILHLIKDEKITDQIIENFVSEDINHIFLIIAKDLGDFKFIKSESDSVIPFDYENDDINKIIQNFSARVILVHALFQPMAKIILGIKNNITVAWIEWGADIYGLPKIRPYLYGFETNRFLLKNNRKLFYERYIKRHTFLRGLYYRFILKKQDPLQK